MDTLSSNISAEFFLAVISGLASLVVAWLNLKKGRLLCLVSEISEPVAGNASPAPEATSPSPIQVRMDIVNYGVADIRHADVQENIRLSLGNGLAFGKPAVLSANTPGMDCQLDFDGQTIELDPGSLFKSGDCMRIEVPVFRDQGTEFIVKALRGTVRIYNIGRLRILSQPQKREITGLLIVSGGFFLLLLMLACVLGYGLLLYLLCLACAPLCLQLIITLTMLYRVDQAKRTLAPSI
jgi:hypothetical protein